MEITLSVEIEKRGDEVTVSFYEGESGDGAIRTFSGPDIYNQICEFAGSEIYGWIEEEDA